LVLASVLITTGAPKASASPTLVTVTMDSVVNPVGTSVTVTATVSPTLAGVDALIRIDGSSGTLVHHCTTSSLGQCSITQVGPSLPGADLITACVDGGLCDEGTVAWILPLSGVGQATGGGQVVPPGPVQDEVGFGFVAKSQNGVPKGNCRVVDPNVDVQVKCLDVTAFVQTGPQAFWFGNAEVNGSAAQYRIDVNDGGEGQGSIDTFAIVTTNGYALAGQVVRGNVQVHM
jgi:hypothetical protein